MAEQDQDWAHSLQDFFLRSPMTLYRQWLNSMQPAPGSSLSEDDPAGSTSGAPPFLAGFVDALSGFLGQAGAPLDDAQWEAACDGLHQELEAFLSTMAGHWMDLPVFGVGRESRKKLVLAAEAQQQLSLALSDFMVRFGRPLQEALAEFGESFEESPGEAGDPQAIFTEFMRFLEGRYDQYLKSPQGIQAVSGFIEVFLNAKEKQTAALDVWLRALDLPAVEDMQAVYRKLYALKKRVHRQQRQLDEQSQTIATLNQRISRLESALS